MQPYFENGSIRLYHGDCREILPSLKDLAFSNFSLLSDPVWPNAIAELQGSDRPFELLREMFAALLFPPVRVALQIGCDSDPRILSAVPEEIPFFRVSWMRYACPGRKGRLLQGADVAYLFGKPPAPWPGHHLIPGEVTAQPGSRKGIDHPCPRPLVHASWLCDRWTEPSDIVIDPFCGSGTTILAAYQHGRKAIGIDIEERYLESAARRFDQGVMPLFAVAEA
jgi:hypothetical protein